MSINRVIISGNLTRDPELRSTQSGMDVMSFGVAVNDRRRNPQTNEWEDYPNFVDCTMFGNRARSLHQYLSKGTKVAILLMNCLEWLPIYFGILKAGAIAVPLNFRYTSDEIDYCLKLADVDVLFFGPEFIGRMETIAPKLSKQMLLLFVGETCPSFAEDYHRATANCSSVAPKILIDDEDEAAIYYSSGTTGFPKAILLKRRRVPVHPAPVPHRRQDALVRLAVHRQ